MVAARRLVAEQDGAAVGVLSVRTHSKERSSANLTGLWVARAVRNRGIETCLVKAAAAIEAGAGKKQMYYWVGTENASAIAFASNTGFRVTSYRRGARTNDDQPHAQEIAFVMPLEPDPEPSQTPAPHPDRSSLARLTAARGKKHSTASEPHEAFMDGWEANGRTLAYSGPREAR